MRTILTILVLTLSSFAQTTISGGATVSGGVSVNATPGSTTIADWSGINAMATGTISQATQLQLGSTVWFWGHSANGGLQIVDSSDTTCALILSGSDTKCALFTYTTASGGDNFGPSYFYLENTVSGWGSGSSRNNNEFLNNGANTNGGIWLQYKFVVDANTSNYLNNTTAQVKFLLNRNTTSGGFTQSNTNSFPDGCGWGMHIIGAGSGDAIKNIRYVSDCTSNGFAKAQQVNSDQTGITIKCQYRRDSVASRGSVRCSTNGTEIVNCDAGTNCFTQYNDYLGSNANTANTAGRWGFALGMRYFAVCTNACSDTTLKFYLTSVKVCDNQCFTYP